MLILFLIILFLQNTPAYYLPCAETVYNEMLAARWNTLKWNKFGRFIVDIKNYFNNNNKI